MLIGIAKLRYSPHDSFSILVFHFAYNCQLSHLARITWHCFLHQLRVRLLSECLDLAHEAFISLLISLMIPPVDCRVSNSSLTKFPSAQAGKRDESMTREDRGIDQDMKLTDVGNAPMK